VASDVLYERSFATALVGFLEARLTAKGEAVVLDPNRSFWETLVRVAEARGLAVAWERLVASGSDEPPTSVLIRITKKYRPPC
jgi:predicted nicotinamide N-methyase